MAFNYLPTVARKPVDCFRVKYSVYPIFCSVIYTAVLIIMVRCIFGKPGISPKMVRKPITN